MCQLLGISSQQPVNPHRLLADFFQRGGATAEHGDGWGIASYDEQGRAQIVKSLSAASQCELARQYLTSEVRSNSFIAHIRKATFGEISLRIRTLLKEPSGGMTGRFPIMVIYMDIIRSRTRYFRSKAIRTVSALFVICYPRLPSITSSIIPGWII